MNLHHVGKQTLLKKVVKQSNHDGANVPLSLREHADEPLYILIALWCLQQNDWVDRQQISDAFGITPRRASFQISYILRHDGRIKCATRKVRMETTGRNRQQLKVQSVQLHKGEGRYLAASRQADLKAHRCSEHRENWRWVLSRQASGMK